jgi:hypothetical protein
MQKCTVIIITTKEDSDPCGGDDEIHTKNHCDDVKGELSKFNKDLDVTCVLQQLPLAPRHRVNTQAMCPLDIHDLPRVRSMHEHLSHFTDMKVKWKEKKTTWMQSDYKIVKANAPLKSTTIMIQRHKFKFPFEANNRLSKRVPFQRTKKIDVGELLKSHPPDQLPLAPQQKGKTQIMWPLATHGLPMVRQRQGRPSHFADMRVKWKEKRMLQMRFILILRKTSVNKNS